MGDKLEDMMGAVVTWAAFFTVVAFIAAVFEGRIETEWTVKVIVAVVASTFINIYSGRRRA